MGWLRKKKKKKKKEKKKVSKGAGLGGTMWPDIIEVTRRLS